MVGFNGAAAKLRNLRPCLMLGTEQTKGHRRTYIARESKYGAGDWKRTPPSRAILLLVRYIYRVIGDLPDAQMILRNIQKIIILLAWSVP
jgi:hypothetical protein